MQCPQCRFDNPPKMKFCGECGSPLAARCPACGTEAPPGFKFCGECGAPLAAAPAPQPVATPAAPEQAPALRVSSPAPREPEPEVGRKAPAESERKLVTVLAAELAGATELAEREGPEVLHRWLDRFLELSRQEVRRYGGTMHQLVGSGFLALFGAPIAHEDHARRALLAALGVRQTMGGSRDGGTAADGAGLSVRVGLDTGSVVVGGVGDLVVGPTPELAARLRQAAGPGEILVTEATAERVEALARLEPAAVAASPGGPSAQAWRVLGSRSGLAEAAFDEGELSPFVGRERELSVLKELLEQAEAGRGQVVGVTGDAGAGKSRLLYELRRSFEGRRVVRLIGECLSWGSGIPYLPLSSMIRRTSGIGEADPPTVVGEKMRASLEQVGLPIEPHLPYLLRLLGVDAGTEALHGLGAQAIQQRTHEAMRRMILAASGRSLVVLELEDLHWVDETSEEFLTSLVEAIGAARVLVLLTYRSGYRPAFLDKSYATQIPMRSLSAEDSQRIVASRLTRAGRPLERIEQIIGKGEGNPFYLEELARAAERQGDEDAAVPDTVQGLLMARIDRLPEEHKRLLRTASVLGREFSSRLLEALWEGSAPGPLLADLERWEFLYAAPSTTEPGYVFKHALTQEVAYGSLLVERRRELHQATAHALETLYSDRLEEAYDRLIYHYPRAKDAEKTVHYLTLFADKAARSYAHAEAARALYEAISHAERLPEGERDRTVLELVVRLADSLLPLARLPETLELLSQHRERVERLGEAGLTGRYRFWLAHTHSYLGDQELAEEHAQRAIEAAKEAADEATQGKAWYVLGRDGFWAGKFRAGLEASLEAVVLLERSGEAWWQGQAYWVAGFHHFVLGETDEAFASMERARTISQALDDYRLDPSWSVGYFHAALGDWEHGIEQCRAGLEIARDPLNTAAAMGFLGYADLQKGDVEQAVATLEDAVERIEGTGMRQLLGWFSTYLGEGYLAAGRGEEARAAVERGLEVCREAEFRFGEGLALRALGRILADGGAADEAARRLEEAVQVLGQLPAPLEVERTLGGNEEGTAVLRQGA